MVRPPWFIHPISIWGILERFFCEQGPRSAQRIWRSTNGLHKNLGRKDNGLSCVYVVVSNRNICIFTFNFEYRLYSILIFNSLFYTHKKKVHISDMEQSTNLVGSFQWISQLLGSHFVQFASYFRWLQHAQHSPSLGTRRPLDGDTALHRWGTLYRWTHQS